MAEDVDDIAEGGTPEPAATNGLHRPGGRLVWLASAALTVVLFFGLILGGSILWITDRPVSAPEWLRARIEARIATSAPGIALGFGDMVLTVHEGWRPKVELRDVTLHSETGTPIMALSDMEATLAMRPLLNGQLQPKTASLSGLFATLRRAQDGALSLQVSADGQSAAREATTLPALIEELDALFARSELAALTNLDLDAVTLRFEDARAKRAWTVDGARLRINRTGEDLRISADLAVLGGGAGVTTLEANYASQIGAPEAEFGVKVSDAPAGDIAAILPAFGWLSALQAPISGSVRSGIGADGAFLPVSATLQIGPGVLQPTPQTRPIPFKEARTYLTYSPALAELVFEDLTVDSPWIKGSLEGRADLRGLESGRLDTLIGQFRLAGLEVHPPEFFAAPVQLDGAEVDFRLTPEPFLLELGQMRVLDQGRSLRLDGQLAAAAQGWQLALNAHAEALTRDRVLELWPETLAQPTRTWLQDNLHAADLSNLELALRSEPGARPDLYLGFDFENVALSYHPQMPRIEGGKGVAALLRDRFVLTLDDGHATPPQGGKLTLGGSSFILPDVTVKDGLPAVVRLRTEGSITAALSLLDEPPLNLIRKTGLPVALADGQAQLRTTLSLPLKKGAPPGSLRYTVSGVLSDVNSTVLVPDRVLEAARLEVWADNDGLRISGAGTFDGIPFDGGWQQETGTSSSLVEADIPVSQATAQALALGLPPGTFSGRTTGALSLELKRNTPPAFTLRAPLRGLGLSIPPLGWSKSRASTGSLEVAGSLGTVPEVNRLDLSAPGLQATGRVELREGGGLERAEFSRVRVGGWFDSPVTLRGRGKGAAPAVEVRGGRLDLRTANFAGSGGGGGQSGPLTLALDRLQITDTIALTGMRGTFEVGRGLEGKFRASVNGKAAIAGTVVPQDGRSAFRLTSSDAGAVFAAAGLLKQARGGDMSLILRPVGTAGAFNGSLDIQNTRVQDAPAIAALFNALSVVGLIEQMGGQGLHFAQVEAAFRLTPDRVTLTEASAVGPSIGLSMDGTYDVNAATMDMRGVFSPIYLINGVGSLLTRKGEGLIGFNFRLQGPASAPRVQVNPLSALTPSIFRELFRRPAPKVAREPGEGSGNSPSGPQTRESEAENTRAKSRVELGGAER